MNSLIYALVDPRHADIYRIIGKSSSGIAWVRRHAKAAQDGERSERADWIRRLLAEGIRYKIVILEKPAAEDLSAREQWWIRRHKRTLLNLSDGGDDTIRFARRVRAVGLIAARQERRAEPIEARIKVAGRTVLT